jgi:hypothetical protein
MEEALSLLGVWNESGLGVRGDENGEKDQHAQERTRFREVQVVRS